MGSALLKNHVSCVDERGPAAVAEPGFDVFRFRSEDSPRIFSIISHEPPGDKLAVRPDQADSLTALERAARLDHAGRQKIAPRLNRARRAGVQHQRALRRKRALDEGRAPRQG